MKYEIKSRFTGCVLFEADIEHNSDAPDTPDHFKLGMAVKQAIKAGADLSNADLFGVNLFGANLAGASLTGVNFAGAHWDNDIIITKAPIQIFGLAYQVHILDTHMQIGCEIHPFDEWHEFDDERILQMDGKKALRFWHDHKSALMTLCMS